MNNSESRKGAMNMNMEAKKKWSTPALTVYGTVEKMTQQFNKIGGSTDNYTQATGGLIVGSVVPVP
jgi:hypothetical protein